MAMPVNTPDDWEMMPHNTHGSQGNNHLLGADMLVSVLCKLGQEPAGDLGVKHLAQGSTQRLALWMLLADIVAVDKVVMSHHASR